MTSLVCSQNNTPKLSITPSGDTLYTFTHSQIKRVAMFYQKGKDCDSLEYKLQSSINKLREQNEALKDGVIVQAEREKKLEALYKIEVENGVICNSELQKVGNDLQAANGKIKRNRAIALFFASLLTLTLITNG